MACCAMLFTPQIRVHVMWRGAQGPQQCELGKVMSEEAGDGVLMRSRHVLLCFYNFQIVGHAVRKAVTRLFQGLLRELLVAFRNVHGAVGCGEICESVAHFIVHAAGEIQILRLLAIELRGAVLYIRAESASGKTDP